MAWCCVPFCTSYTGNTAPGTSFHAFPNNPTLKEMWIVAILRQGAKPGSLWQPSKCSSVCSKHFKDTDFSISTTKKRLLPNVVPSVYPIKPQYQINPSFRKVPLQSSENSTKIELETSLDIGLNVNIPTTSSEPSENLPLISSSSLKVEMTSLNNSPPSSSVTNFDHSYTRIAEPKISLPLSSVTNLDHNYFSKTNSIGIQVSCNTLSDKLKSKYIRTCNSYSANLYYLRSSIKRLKKKVKVMKEKSKMERNKSRLELKLAKIKEGHDCGDLKASFILDQINAYKRKKVHYGESSLRVCALWRKIAPIGYEAARSLNILPLPHSKTLMDKHHNV